MKLNYIALLLSSLSLPCLAMLRQAEDGYVLSLENQEHLVKRYDVHPFLRNLTPTQLEKYQQVGNRIKSVRLSNGDYVVRPGGELLGGGPGLAWISYVSINAITAASAAATAWCPPLALTIALTGHAAATATAIALVATPTP